jgi:hypothetical protein
MLTQCISNSQRIRADSARVDWSKAVQASPVQVQKNWGLVRSRSKNYSDRIGLDLDGPGPDWSIAGLVESLFISAHLWIPTLDEIMTVLSVYLVPSRYISPIKRQIQRKNTLNLDTVLDWSKSVQASSVQVQKKWGLVRSRSKNYSDWIGLDLDGPGLDWSNAGLVESLVIRQHRLQHSPSANHETIFIHNVNSSFSHLKFVV